MNYDGTGEYFRRYLEEKTTLTMLIMKLAEYADSLEPFSSSIDALFPTTI